LAVDRAASPLLRGSVLVHVPEEGGEGETSELPLGKRRERKSKGLDRKRGRLKGGDIVFTTTSVFPKGLVFEKLYGS